MTHRNFTTAELRDIIIAAVKSEMPSLIREVISEQFRHTGSPTAPKLSDDSFVSRKAAAQRLSVSVQTVAKLILSGELPVTRIGRRVLINKADIQKLVQNRRTRLTGGSDE